MPNPNEIQSGAIPRKYLAHFIDAAFGAVSADYVRLGKDLEELNTEFNANVEKKQNILGESSIKITGYEASDEVEPYFLEVGDKLSEKLIELAHGRETLDKLKTTIVDVHLWKGSDNAKLEAYKEVCYVEIKTLGGDVNGTQTSFVIHRTGIIEKGTFNLGTKAFAPASLPAAA